MLCVPHLRLTGWYFWVGILRISITYQFPYHHAPNSFSTLSQITENFFFFYEEISSFCAATDIHICRGYYLLIFFILDGSYWLVFKIKMIKSAIFPQSICIFLNDGRRVLFLRSPPFPQNFWEVKQVLFRKTRCNHNFFKVKKDECRRKTSHFEVVVLRRYIYFLFFYTPVQSFCITHWVSGI